MIEKKVELFWWKPFIVNAESTWQQHFLVLVNNREKLCRFKKFASFLQMKCNNECKTAKWIQL